MVVAIVGTVTDEDGLRLPIPGTFPLGAAAEAEALRVGRAWVDRETKTP